MPRRFSIMSASTTFADFGLDRAKHFVPATPAGHVIGDMIILRERDDRFILVGRAPTANSTRFQAAIGKWRVRLTHDPRSDSYEASGSIGGSFVSDDIADYCVNPFELGYGFYIGWKSEFIGKEALAKMADGPDRRKITFEWNREDVLKVIASGFEDATPYKWIGFPLANYAASNADMVMQGDRMVGLSMFSGYSFNERCMLSLGVVAPEVSKRDVLTLRRGEPDDTAKTSTERHQQAGIRVPVGPTPYAREARENCADSWRTRC